MAGVFSMRLRSGGACAFALAVLASCAATAEAQVVLPDWNTVRPKTSDLGGGVSMIEGFGGNIGVVVGDDGVVVIDDEYDALISKNVAAIRAITKKPVRFVINTHWHPDHVGGNVGLTRLGAAVFATDETRGYIEAYDKVAPEKDRLGAPIGAFSDALTFHLGAETVRAVKIPPAHTGGDAIVIIQPANIIHVGDASFNGFYPSIDIENGGGIDGMIRAQELIYALADDQTRIIFGHGPVGTRADLLRYRDMLETVRSRVADALKKGVSLEDLIAQKPLADLDPKWGGNLIKAPDMLTMVYLDLQKRGN